MGNDRCQEIVWQLPQKQPIIEEGQVHIWQANLDLSSTEIASLSKILSADEMERADRFRFPLHRNRFIAARSILRQLLGNYLKLSPDSLTFKYGDRGKPFLAESKQDSSLQFNLSHSQQFALYGFTYHHCLGVDLEYIREMPDALKIAQRFFSDSEYKLLKSAAKEQQKQIFFQLWTAKEAYLKAIGTGLSGSLASVDLALNQAQYPCLLSVNGNTTAVADWSLFSCIPHDNYVAAIALETSVSFGQIVFWHQK